MMVLVDLGVSEIIAAGRDCLIWAVTVLYVQNLAVAGLYVR